MIKWHEVGIGNFFVEIQQKVNKKFGKVKIKAYFCRLNKYITLKTRRLWQ